MELIQSIIQGLLLGGLYAAIGIGMNLIFGIVNLTNLAHGDFLILASYISFAVITGLGVEPLVSLIIVVPVMFIIGFVIQNTMLNKVLGQGPNPPLLITFGLSVVIQNLLLYFFTADARFLHSSLTTGSLVITDTIRISYTYLIGCVVGALLIIVLAYYFKNTYQGKAIMAASDDKEAAQLMGVNIKNIYGIAMGISLATAGVAGVLIGMIYNFYPTSGSSYLVIAFAVVVIGGIGSTWGTLFAGLIFGIAQVLGAYFFGASAQLLTGYVVLLIMLIVRPQGLFSR
ncbi:MAG: branched-chain amino acid ABC transporter permease [Anaerovoracaceae bacterium]